MDKNYKVTVNNIHDFEINTVSVSNLDALQISESEYHILQENKSYKAEITNADFNKKLYQVKVNNTTYNINIFNNLDVLIKNMGFSVSDAKYVNTIKAPMPGLILEICVDVGQNIKENDTLFILEAMKMENSITSPRDGIIKYISVKKGDTVDKHRLLIEFE
tara:strand:- start:1513 stop:1998 length:486 start_codon:yes stop_codon:yes gene_type:complete